MKHRGNAEAESALRWKRDVLKGVPPISRGTSDGAEGRSPNLAFTSASDEIAYVERDAPARGGGDVGRSRPVGRTAANHPSARDGIAVVGGGVVGFVNSRGFVP